MTESGKDWKQEKHETSHSEEEPQQGETVEDADAQAVDGGSKGWQTPKQ